MQESNERHRRHADTKIGELADSSLLKLLQYLVTMIALPIITWAITNTAARLGEIEAAMHKINTINATYELRMRNMEQLSMERTAIISQLSNRVLVLEQEMRVIQRPSGKP